MKKYIIAGAALASLVVPAAASASFDSEYQAGNKVEQAMQRQYPRYTVFAFCDQQGRRFWCSVHASRGDCFVSGHAWVSKNPWRVRMVGVNRTCI